MELAESDAEKLLSMVRAANGLRQQLVGAVSNLLRKLSSRRHSAEVRGEAAAARAHTAASRVRVLITR